MVSGRVGGEKMASFGGEVGQLEECRLIGNTEVNGKYAGFGNVRV